MIGKKIGIKIELCFTLVILSCFLVLEIVRNQKIILNEVKMFWTPELAKTLEDAPWPSTKEELLDYANRVGTPMQVIENLMELDDTDELIEGMEDLWTDYEDMANEEYFYNDDEEELYY